MCWGCKLMGANEPPRKVLALGVRPSPAPQFLKKKKLDVDY